MSFSKPLSELWVGIDPGLSGAVAVIDSKGNVISLQDAPTINVKRGKKNHRVYLETQMATILENARDAGRVICVGLENVHAMPGQGVSSCFTFGMGFGIWLGILAALRLPIQKIEPAKWKREMGLVGDDKGKSIVKALQLFPYADITLKRHDGRAESLLLACWLQRQRTLRRY